MAWTASSILGPALQTLQAPPPSRQTPAQKREQLRSQTLNDPSLGGFGPTPTPGRQQVSSSIPVRGGSSMPSFLSNPSGVLSNAMFPYEELLARIFAPPAATSSLPPALAQAYAAQANANAARIQQQVATSRAAASLPAQLADARARERELSGWSLYGLPTGLSYQDPLRSAQNTSFNIQAAMLPRTSGWTAPAFPVF